MGDFNGEPNDVTMKSFCQIYGCKNTAKGKTCFRNPINPTCIDLIITDRRKSFQESEVTETGLSGFHKTSLTVMKVFYKIFPIKLSCMNQKVLYRVFLKFHLEHFKVLSITYFKNMLL